MAKEWRKSGHHVTVVCGSGQFSDPLPFFVLYKTYSYERIKVVRFNVAYSHFMPFKRRLWAFFIYFSYAALWLVPKRNYDLVYASSTPLSVGALGAWCNIWQKVPMVFEVVDLWPDVPVEMGFLKNPLIIAQLYKLEKWIYGKADKIIALSEGMGDKIVLKGVAENKVVVAHNGTNCSLFFPCTDKKSAKRNLGFPEDEFWVLYAGTIGQANGLPFLVEVASHIQSFGETTIRFVVLGNGNRKEELIRYASQIGVSNVLFVETVPKAQVKRYFDAADVGAVIFAPYTILETNSANKFFDYLACGLPVLLNYKGWQKEFLEENGCGASELEAYRFALRLAEWRLKPDKMALMGKKARGLASTHFDRKDIAHKIAGLFRQICEKA